MTQRELYDAMFDGKCSGSWPYPQAFATLSRAIKYGKLKWPAGKRVRVVMASRLGDLGITDKLDVEHGYHYRVQCVEASFQVGGQEIKCSPDTPDLLVDIELLIKEPA